MVIVMLGPAVRCPSESLRNGVMVMTPGGVLAGMTTVSDIVIESRRGLENSTESFRTTAPVELRPSERTLSSVLPLTVTRIDLPTTAELPDVGLITLTSGGGMLPTASLSVSTPELLPAPSMAMAVTITGVPGGTARDANRVNG